MLALVDCNNFYVSCERVFQPLFEQKPTIVLSNNDGCAISRSNEAKSLGIKMGQPYFEIKDLCSKYDVNVLSSNYTLYADMSSRVMSILKDLSVQQEIYSIDESFLDLTGINDLTTHGQKIRTTVKQWVGIPVCVGIAPTKVLAKFANYLAKKYKFINGVCNLEDLGRSRVERAMQITSVGEIWGVGHKIRKRLELMGIKSVYDLKIANPKHLTKIFGVNIERIVYELNGIQCLSIECYQEPNKQIVSSRSFGQSINKRDDLLASLTYHVEHVCSKMRKQGLYARQLIVFAHTNRFKPDYFSQSVSILLPEALDSYRYMAKTLDRALDVIYKPHTEYKKAGVIINDLITGEHETRDLFDNINIKHDPILPTLELIKKRFGKASLKVATASLSDNWNMSQNLISQRYTTYIDEILKVS